MHLAYHVRYVCPHIIYGCCAYLYGPFSFSLEDHGPAPKKDHHWVASGSSSHTVSTVALQADQHQPSFEFAPQPFA